MPITYHFDASTRIVHAAVEGPITQDEVRDTLRRLSTDPDYHPNPRIYCDARRADFTDITYRWYLSVIGQEEVYAPYSATSPWPWSLPTISAGRWSGCTRS